MAGETDPITLIHEGAWAALATLDPDGLLIKPGNRIKLDRHDAIKQTIQDADLPEVLLIPRQGAGNITATSSSVSMEVTFDWLISTGTYAVAARLYPTLWLLFRTMHKFLSTARSLQYKDRAFVNGVALNSASVGETDPERNRGIRGFSAAMNFTVKLTFPIGDINV